MSTQSFILESMTKLRLGLCNYRLSQECINNNVIDLGGGEHKMTLAKNSQYGEQYGKLLSQSKSIL